MNKKILILEYVRLSIEMKRKKETGENERMKEILTELQMTREEILIEAAKITLNG